MNGKLNVTDLSISTGKSRTRKDFHWLEKSVPCRFACPARTDIPGYLSAIAQGDFARAYRINLLDNVFPAVLGRICSRPCEPACRHGDSDLGLSVGICFSKRAGADYHELDEPVLLPPFFDTTGKSVVVVGAGPAGLAAARQLSLFGHTVTVLDQHSQPGGMMVQTIPPFRLPRDILNREVKQIEAQGVRIQCNVAVGKDVSIRELLDQYDAVAISAGCTRSHVPGIPGVTLSGVVHGQDYLWRAISGEGTITGTTVAVIGGGFTAADCARTALRLGAEKVTIYYRRRRGEMALPEGEYEEIEREGIGIEFCAVPIAFEGKYGRLQSVRFVRTDPSANKHGSNPKGKLAEIPDSEWTEPAKTVILATGQYPDYEGFKQWLPKNTEMAQTEPDLNPPPSPLFTAGDFRSGSTTVIEAIASGKECALEVDAFLMGQPRVAPQLEVINGRDIHRPVDQNRIPAQPMPQVPLDQRTIEAEVEQGYDSATAVLEARRCYLCNYKYEIDTTRCIYCDLCCEVKPRADCILKVERVVTDLDGCILEYQSTEGSFSPAHQYVYRINPSQCIRCNACLEVCPVQCIEVQSVELHPYY